MGSRSRHRSGFGCVLALVVCLLALLTAAPVLAVAPGADEATPTGASEDQLGPNGLATSVERPLPAVTGDTTVDSTAPQDPQRTAPVRTAIRTADGDRLDPMATDRTGTALRTIDLDRSYQRLPARPGEVLVEHRYTIPDGVSRLELRLPERTTVVDREGFVRSEDGRLTWDQSSQAPRVTYRYEVNRTLDHDGPIQGPGDYIFVDAGEWALLNQPSTGHSWGWTGGGTVRMATTQRTDGPGAASEQIVFLGEHRTRSHTAHGQRFDLVVPEAASLAESPTDIFDALSVGSDRLRVGDRDDRVFLVAAPTGQVQWGARGIQTGGADIWVRDIERLDTPSNVWLHEYVHSRQSYQTTEETRWFTEASATYYAALFALEAGEIDFEQFRDHLNRGTDPRFGGVLSLPDTWQNNADYVAGSLVSGELDRRIRLAADSERSLQDVFRYMNEAPEPVTDEQLLSFVERVGDPSVRSDTNRYLTTEERPQIWTIEDHRTAFGTDPARIEYRLAPPANEDAYRVTGGFRTSSLGPERPIRLVRGEQLSVGGSVTNAGGVDGNYEARFRVNGGILDRRSGRLAPGESASLSFDHTFETTGEYTVAIGDGRTRISVLDPATPEVTGISVNRSRIGPGGAVDVSITIANTADRPGELRAPLLRNGEEIDRLSVRLAPGESVS